MTLQTMLQKLPPILYSLLSKPYQMDTFPWKQILWFLRNKEITRLTCSDINDLIKWESLILEVFCLTSKDFLKVPDLCSRLCVQCTFGEKTHKCADLSCSASDEALANGGQETGEKNCTLQREKPVRMARLIVVY